MKGGGSDQNLAFLLKSWEQAEDRGSTIIYIATQKGVDNLVAFLSPALRKIDASCVVMGYHAGVRPNLETYP